MARNPQLLTAGVAVGAGALLLAQAMALPQTPAQTRAAPGLTTRQVVARMVAMNEARTRALHAFSALRSYQVRYSG
ncbi:MAG: hypothetical protein ACRD0Y_05170, partial [Terriglobales bacterium]